MYVNMQEYSFAPYYTNNGNLFNLFLEETNGCPEETSPNVFEIHTDGKHTSRR